MPQKQIKTLNDFPLRSVADKLADTTALSNDSDKNIKEQVITPLGMQTPLGMTQTHPAMTIQIYKMTRH